MTTTTKHALSASSTVRDRVVDLAPTAFALLLGVVSGCLALSPIFGGYVAGGDFYPRITLVSAALDTWRSTGALPFSTNTLWPGIEYPFFLFESPFFYIAGSFISYVTGLPPYLGAGIAVGALFVVGSFSTFLIARSLSVNPYVSACLGVLYAVSPTEMLNMLQRQAFPEYMTWQALPLLYLMLSYDRRRPSPLGALASALALAAPFYLHKLLAPHLALILVAMAWLNSSLSVGRVARYALISVIAVLFTVPSWLPVSRGLDVSTVDTLTFGQTPLVMHSSIVNLFWPWLQDSLAGSGRIDVYDGKFGMQVGILPSIGILVTIIELIRSRGRSIDIQAIVLLLIAAVYTIGIMGYFSVWDYVPRPLRLLQFSGRVVGIVHFAGFILLLRWLRSAFRAEDGLRATRTGLAVSAGLAIVGLAATVTYWNPPPKLTLRSAELGTHPGMDAAQIFLKSSRSAFLTNGAIAADGTLNWKPIVIPLRGHVTRMMLAGRPVPDLFTISPDPVKLTMYGVVREGATTVAVDTVVETALTDSSPVTLEATFTREYQAVAVGCTRGVPTALPGREVCLLVDYLSPPNSGNEFVPPAEIPPARQQRGAYGTITIDAAGLPVGTYLLPTYDYGFVRVTDRAGQIVERSHFDARPVIAHNGVTDQYTIWYDLGIERLALIAAILLSVVYVGVNLALRR